MKLRYLSFILLALGAQPTLAAAPASGDTNATIMPSITIGSARAQELQRVADALTAETMKARIKAMKRPIPADAPLPCKDCPEKAAVPHPDSASQVRNHDCITCVEEAILA